MSGLVTALVDGFSVIQEKRVTAIHEMEGRYALSFEDGATEAGFDRVVVAVPAPQAGNLLAAFGAPFDRIGLASMAPCWTLIAALESPIDPGFDMARDRGNSSGSPGPGPSPAARATSGSRRPIPPGRASTWRTRRPRSIPRSSPC